MGKVIGLVFRVRFAAEDDPSVENERFSTRARNSSTQVMPIARLMGH